MTSAPVGVVFGRTKRVIRQPTGASKERRGDQVRALRTQRGLAQGQLAEAMGVSRQTINSIENDRYTPSLPLALALARYFSVTVEEMFDDQES
jgi:putative transcriptional regulator